MEVSSVRLRSLALSVGLAALGFASAADAQELRFETTQPGNVIATGNALGLAKQLALNGPGTEDSIGTFTTLNTALADTTPVNPANPWGPGTTRDWTQNGSSAVLTLPVEATVLYAELVWGGSFQDGGVGDGDNDVESDLGTPVTLSFGGQEISVSPDVNTGEIYDQGVFHYYMRSANVTAFVQSNGNGSYSVEGVPATQSGTINTTNAAGWTLIVAYRYDNEPIRNMSIFVGGVFVDENSTVDYTVDGFCAPPSEPIEGTIAVSTIEGDANRTGDQLAIGITSADPTFIPLSGPNNPVNNFFCSQINASDGLVDTSGTFGMANHETTDTNSNPALNDNNVSGARQGWDVAQVALSSDEGHLEINQTSAVLRAQTASDSFMPVLAGIAIEVNAPKFLYENSGTEVDKDSVSIGDTFTVDVTLLNEGTATANNVLFNMDLVNGISLESFSTNGTPGDITGAAVTQAMLNTGVNMGNIAPNASRQLEMVFEVTSAPTSNIVIKPVWHYDYQICIAGAPTNEEFNGEIETVTFIPGMGEGGAGGLGGAGGQGAEGGVGGEGAVGAEGGSGGSGGGIGAYPQGGGFISCSSSPSTSGAFGAAFFAMMLGLGVARRRKARKN